MQVVRIPPVVAEPSPTAATSTGIRFPRRGTALLFTAIAVALHLRLRPEAEVGHIFLGTLRRVKTSLLTIAAMLAIAYTVHVRRARPPWGWRSPPPVRCLLLTPCSAGSALP